MSVFVEAQTDPFVAERTSMKEDYQTQFRSNANIRRPTRGHVLKEDSYAVLRVMDSSGNFIPVLDAAGEEIYTQDGKAYTTYYSNFFVQTVQEQRSEKQQIVDTFGDTYIFFFGEAPRLIQVQGMLLNTSDFNWRDEFWENYDRYFRGTKLVERGARLYLIYDEVIVEGYMVSASATESAENPWVMPFGFQMFVTGQTALSSIGDPVIRGYDEYGTYRGNGEGYYDSSTNKWVNSTEADRNIAADSTAGTEAEDGAGGKLLTDTLREGTASAGDPSTTDYTQQVASAIGEGNRIDFKPNPRTGGGRYINNIDEFVQTSIKQKEKGLDYGGDEWGKASSVIDSGVDSSVSGGGSSIVSNSDFIDVMGRGGRASNEIASTGGARLRGEGIRRDLGGSDLKSSRDVRSAASRPQRDTPFGMTVQSGDLL